MHYFLLVTLLAGSALLASADEDQNYSFSPLVGSNSGSPFSLTGDERITGVRLWDSGYIYGIQLRYGAIWGEVAGSQSGQVQEFTLSKDEAIIQISGKHHYYISWLMFVTNKGRSLIAGNPSGTSFNMYPEHEEAELRFISGSQSGIVYSFSAHWAVVP